MPRVTEFGIIAVFQRQDGRLTVQPRMLFPSEEDARRAAEIFAEVLGGAVAFSRVVDRESGFAEDGVIIAKFGVMAESSGEDFGAQAHTASQAPSRDRLRPPLRDSPERYILTFFEAQLRLCALARAARREKSSGFARMWDEAGEMKLDLRTTSGDGDDPGRPPSIASGVALLAREARSLHELGLHELDEACPDARWFVKMTGAWAFTLAGTNAEAAWNGALACAIDADEQAFFDRVLAPWITHRFRQDGPDPQRPELDDLVAATRDPQARLPASASSRG
jgi:hypothetical protein